MKFKFVALFCILTPLLFSCKKNDDETPAGTVQIDDKFDISTNSWTGDFADYPAGEESFYELSYTHDKLPEPLDQTAKGIRISGNNHSDDLFMFIKKQVTGLIPNQQYTVQIEIELASNEIKGSLGVGGSPGESVIVKSGLTAIEPVKTLDAATNYYRMNIDKSNQSNSGEDMKVLGDISNGTEKNEYTLIKRTGTFTGKADKDGNAWIVIGTDSGYEATTTLYYTQVKVSIVKDASAD